MSRVFKYGKQTINIPNYLPLDRSDLYDSEPVIQARNWDKIFAMPSEGGIDKLERLRHELFIDLTKGKKPVLKQIDTILQLPKPLMICEYGFGHTTYELLKLCHQHDMYLVTVEMPIAPDNIPESDEYPELYYWGVDRYERKYKHCVQLLDNPIAKKRWLWINDDIFKVSNRIVDDMEYRHKLFLNGKISYFYEDAIHDDEFLEQLYKKIKPFIKEGGVFTGDDNTPTYFV